MQLIDTHTHIQFPDYDPDRAEVIGRARRAGVKILCVGINAETSAGAIKLAEQYPDDVWASIGWHPNEDIGNFVIEELRNLAVHPKVVAIGETGLDYYRTGIKELGIKALQKKIFLEQINLAEELKKPLMIHCRPAKGTDDGYEDLLKIPEFLNCPVSKIIHFFTGSPEAAQKLMGAGCYFTFGGVITFSRDYDEVIKFLPLTRILLETDSPYVTPAPYRGKRNEPAYVVEVAKKMAEIKGLTFEKVARATYNNFYAVFVSLPENRN